MTLSKSHVLWPLLQLGKSDPNKVLFSFVDETGKVAETRTTSQFINRIENLAGYLRHGCNLKPGDVALLIYPPSLEFVECFAACLLAGVVAAPVYPPNLARPDNDLERLEAIAQQSQAKAMLTNRVYRWGTRIQSAKNLMGSKSIPWPNLPWYVTQGLSWFTSKIELSSEDVHHETAILQFTSGSTSIPKGVEISHKNLNHQLKYNAEVLGMNADSRLVMWVPQYHDLGLISGILSILQGNGSLYFMSPFSFLKRPAVWFETINAVRATHTAAPNFGYELVTRKTAPEMRAKWDLSCLKVCMSAAEPIVPRTVDAFLEAFAPAKLLPQSFCPAYGLAEHTVGITIGGKSRLKINRQEAVENQMAQVDPTSDYELISCGSPGFGIQVRIVSPQDKRVLKEGGIGEIYAQSDSVAKGYRGLSELSTDVFYSKLDGEEGYWLKTGDLGFVHGGELFVTGRQKDLVIIRGKNFNPETIEESIRTIHPKIRPGGIAAFSVPGLDTEKLVALVEVTDSDEATAQEVAKAVKKQISEVWQLQATVGITTPHSVKKTTSGKVQRNLCRKAWLEGQFEKLMKFEEVAIQKASENLNVDQRPIVEQLLDIAPDDRLDYMVTLMSQVAQKILPEGFSRLGMDDFLPEAGLDSLSTFDLITALEERINTPLTQTLFIEHPTLRSSAMRILYDLGVEHTGELVTPEQEKQFEFRPKHRGLLPAKTSIGIIGAGVGGMVSALELARLGYKKITIFEADSKCGGKVSTEHRDGDVLELGQNVLIDSFQVLIQLARSLKCEFVPASPVFLRWDEEHGFEPGATRPPYRNWIRSVYKAARVQENPRLPLPQMLEGLDDSFESFLKKHKINGPHPLFFFEWNSMGYGMDLDISASYVISYLQTLGTSGNVCRIKGGNQSLWTKLAQHLETDWGVQILHNHAVSSVQNHGDQVQVTANGKEFIFDEVILATPPEILKKILPKEDPLQEILGHFESYQFKMNSFKAENFMEYGAIYPDQLVFSIGGPVGLQACGQEKNGWHVIGQYASSFEAKSPRLSDEKLKEIIDDTVGKMGGKIISYGPDRSWSYFPHTRHQPSQTLRKAESLQGTRHIWATGSWISFETTEQVARHAQHLIQTCFDPAGGEDEDKRD